MTSVGARHRLRDRLGATWLVTLLGLAVVAGIAVLLITSVRSGVDEVRAARRTQAAAAVSHEAIRAVTAMQAERGIAELVEAFGDGSIRVRYQDAVATTDAALENLRAAWDHHKAALASASPPTMTDALGATQSLGAIRRSAGEAGDASTFEAYSSIVDLLLSANQSIGVLANNGSPIRSALTSLLRASESLGRERALVTTLIAAAEPASSTDQVRLSLLEREVRVSLRSAATLLGSPLAERIQEVSTGPLAAEAQSLLAQIGEGGDDRGAYTLSPDEWFDEATARIDALVAIATDVNSLLAEAAADRISSARRALTVQVIGLGSLLLIAMLGAAAAVVASRERASALREYAELADGLQRWFLPEALPEVASLEVAARYLPASQRTRAGGDWYDIYELDPQRVAFVIGDVAGHGPHASAQMAEVRNLMRGQLIAFPKSPGAQLGLLEATLRGTNVFATAFLGILELETGTLRYSRAGHVPPVVATGAGRTELHEDAAGPPLGCGLAEVWPEAEIALTPGSVLLLYTDGLVESRRHGVDVGISRLAAQFQPLDRPLGTVADDLLAARPDSANEDDIALLVVRWTPPPA